MNLYGGERGAMNDSRLLRQSRLLSQLKTKMQGFQGGNYKLYGDLGYFCDPSILMKLFSKTETTLDPRRAAANKFTSSLRIYV